MPKMKLVFKKEETDEIYTTTYIKTLGKLPHSPVIVRMRLLCNNSRSLNFNKIK
jgi:hypothetical protein